MQCSCACIRLVICQPPTLLFLSLCFCQSHRMLFQNIGLKNINSQNFHIIQNKGSPCFISRCLKGSSGTEKNCAPKAELTKVPTQSSLNLQTSYSPFNLVIFQMLFICILLLKNSCVFFFLLQPPVCTYFKSRTADLHLHLLFQYQSQEELHETRKTGLKKKQPPIKNQKQKKRKAKIPQEKPKKQLSYETPPQQVVTAKSTST